MVIFKGTVVSFYFLRNKGPSNIIFKKMKIFAYRISGTLNPVDYDGENRFL